MSFNWKLLKKNDIIQEYSAYGDCICIIIDDPLIGNHPTDGYEVSFNCMRLADYNFSTNGWKNCEKLGHVSYLKKEKYSHYAPNIEKITGDDEIEHWRKVATRLQNLVNDNKLDTELENVIIDLLRHLKNNFGDTQSVWVTQAKTLLNKKYGIKIDD